MNVLLLFFWTWTCDCTTKNKYPLKKIFLTQIQYYNAFPSSASMCIASFIAFFLLNNCWKFIKLFQNYCRDFSTILDASNYDAPVTRCAVSNYIKNNMMHFSTVMKEGHDNAYHLYFINCSSKWVFSHCQMSLYLPGFILRVAKIYEIYTFCFCTVTVYFFFHSCNCSPELYRIWS
jgi:hypothetical protein